MKGFDLGMFSGVFERIWIVWVWRVERMDWILGGLGYWWVRNMVETRKKPRNGPVMRIRVLSGDYFG